MNCSLWTITLIKIWTYWMIPSYSRGKSGFHNVSTQAHFDMSLFPPKTLDWPMMTLTSTSSSLLDCSSSWSHRKKTSPLCWPTISLICLQTLLWNWRKLLQNFTVNNFLTISDVQLRSLTTSLWWSPTKFDYYAWYTGVTPLFIMIWLLSCWHVLKLYPTWLLTMMNMMAGLFVFFCQKYMMLPMIELVTWQQFSEFYIYLCYFCLFTDGLVAR